MINAEVDDSDKGDEEITNAAKADAKKTLEAKDDARKIELPPSSSSLSVSSGFGDQFLNLSSDSSLVSTVKDTTDTKINSLPEVKIQSEVPHTPLMIDWTDFASWKQCIQLYCRGTENRVNILKSIDEGQFPMGTLRDTLTEGTKGALHLGPERPRVYSDHTSEEKDRYNADIQATNILLQGLPKDIYSLINHYTNAKDIWDNVKMLLEGSKLTKKDRESQLFVITVKLNRGLRNSNYDQLYAYLKQHEGRQNRGQWNNARGAGATGYGGAQNRVGYASLEYFKDKMLLMQAQENRVALYEEQLLFIAGGQDNAIDEDVDEQPVQNLALDVDNVFQTDDCDAFDFDVDEAPTAQTMFMANLLSADPVYDEAGPSYDLDILSEYVKDNAVQVVQSDVSVVPNDAYKMILNDMHELPAQHVYVTTQTKVVDKSLTTNLATYKEQVKLYERRDKFELTEREQKINEQLRIVSTNHSITPKVLAAAMYAIDVEPIPPSLRNNREVRLDYLKHLKESVATLHEIVEEAKVERPLDRSVESACLYTKHSQELLEYVIHIVLWYLDLGCSKHMTEDRSRLKNFMRKFTRAVRFRNDHFGAIIGQFCDSDLEVTFGKHSCYVRDLDGVELIKGSCGSNLYTISIKDMMKSSPICLLSKDSKTKSWLGHYRLNHLNFDTINDLARKDLVRGLLRLKFEKDHLCSACQLGKSKKHTYSPKTKNTSLEVLNTLHMDLCGPVRVQTINGKKYILVIVDDYTWFTWVKVLRSKDETLEVVIKFLKKIQVGLNKTVRFIHTDSGTKFVNHHLTHYYESVSIFHQKLVSRTPQQSGVVLRRNHTLVEASRTMLIFSKVSMFLWAEAVAIAFYTQNCSLIHTIVITKPYMSWCIIRI
nr:hypothetical protein [Tanacetum cinerariifolium]